MGEELPLDIVTTPLGEYLVINYLDPSPHKNWDFTDRLPMRLSQADEDFSLDALLLGIADYVRERPDVVVESYSRGLHLRMDSIDIPGGPIGVVLSDERILQVATREYLAYQEKIEKNRDSRIHYEDPGPLDRWLIGIGEKSKQTVWNQLIRQSSQNDLTMSGHHPSMALRNCEGSGFIILDNGMDSNHGFGKSRIQVYEVMNRLVGGKEPVGPFPSTTAYVRRTAESWIQRLPASKMCRLDGIVAPDRALVNFYGAPALLGMPKGSVKGTLLRGRPRACGGSRVPNPARIQD